jgi:hypothetical protein
VLPDGESPELRATIVDPIARVRKKRTRPSKRGVLANRTVLKLRLNNRGRKLLGTGDLSVRLVLTVRRGTQEFRPRLPILRLLQSRR